MAVVETVSRYRWVILTLSLLCQISAALAGQVLAPLAPLFQPELGLSKAEVGLFSIATFAGAWSVLLIAGSITDRVGIRRMMSLGQFAAGGLLLSMSTMNSAVQAWLVMFAAGIARGMVFPGSTKAVMEWFSPTTRATAMGLKQTGAPVGGIITAATLPAIALVLGWRSAIAVAGAVIIAAGVAAALVYRDPPDRRQKHEARPGILAGMRDVLRNRRLWLFGSIAMTFVTAQQALLTYLALYFKDVVLVESVPDERARIVAAGGYLAICQVGGVMGRVLWGWVSDRLLQRRRVLAMAIIGILAAATFLLVAGIDPGYPGWLLSAVVFACGITAVSWNGVYHALVTETAGRQFAGTGVGMSLTMVESGSMIGPPIFGLIADLTGSYRPAWVFLACLSIAGSLVAVAAARERFRLSSETVV